MTVPSETACSHAATSRQYKYCTPEAAEEAAHAAAKVSRRMSRDCRILDKKKEDAVPRIFRHELVLGKLLGRGGFSNVYEIVELDLSKIAVDEPNESIQYQIRARNFLSDHCIREKTGDARYAVKFLKREVMANERKFIVGAADLALEARLLSSLDHPNIVKMRGVAAEGVAGFATGLEGGYFVIMDRLYDTLEVRIQQWKEFERHNKGVIHKSIMDMRGKKRREFLAQRLNVAFDIAGALKYLHNHNIMFRDLKPENVGFDVRGDVKIFDFGLAKEVSVSRKLRDGTYRLSGNTGSPRYMAPEVAQSLPYNFTADSYSLGTLLWEMIAMEKPFEGFDRETHNDMVLRGGMRPNIPKSWPVPLRLLIKRSWSEKITERPSMSSTYNILRALITKLRNGDDTGLEHSKRRSTHVLQQPKPLPALEKSTPGVGLEWRSSRVALAA